MIFGLKIIEILGDKVFALKERIPVFEMTCKQMLEDIQERLVYRTQMYIKSDIVGYKPVAGDLAYPEKLIMMRQIAESLNTQPAKGLSITRVQTDQLIIRELENPLGTLGINLGYSRNTKTCNLFELFLR